METTDEDVETRSGHALSACSEFHPAGSDYNQNVDELHARTCVDMVLYFSPLAGTQSGSRRASHCPVQHITKLFLRDLFNQFVLPVCSVLQVELPMVPACLLTDLVVLPHHRTHRPLLLHRLLLLQKIEDLCNWMRRRRGWISGVMVVANIAMDFDVAGQHKLS